MGRGPEKAWPRVDRSPVQSRAWMAVGNAARCIQATRRASRAPVAAFQRLSRQQHEIFAEPIVLLVLQFRRMRGGSGCCIGVHDMIAVPQLPGVASSERRRP